MSPPLQGLEVSGSPAETQLHIGYSANDAIRVAATAAIINQGQTYFMRLGLSSLLMIASLIAKG
jgi:hypothetical protein